MSSETLLQIFFAFAKCHSKSTNPSLLQGSCGQLGCLAKSNHYGCHWQRSCIVCIHDPFFCICCTHNGQIQEQQQQQLLQDEIQIQVQLREQLALQEPVEIQLRRLGVFYPGGILDVSWQVDLRTMGSNPWQCSNENGSLGVLSQQAGWICQQAGCFLQPKVRRL